MTEFSYTEVNAEIKALGYHAYGGADDDFTETEVSEAIAGLGEYYLMHDLVVLTGRQHHHAVVKAFALLADAIASWEEGQNQIETDGISWKIQRPTTQEERRNSALLRLKAARHEQHRKLAGESLHRKYEAAENH